MLQFVPFLPTESIFPSKLCFSSPDSPIILLSHPSPPQFSTEEHFLWNLVMIYRIWICFPKKCETVNPKQILNCCSDRWRRTRGQCQQQNVNLLLKIVLPRSTQHLSGSSRWTGQPDTFGLFGLCFSFFNKTIYS